MNSTMKLSWLVKLSTEVTKISFCTAVSERKFTFVEVFFPSVWGCEGFTASVSQKWGFLGNCLSQDKKNGWKNLWNKVP